MSLCDAASILSRVSAANGNVKNSGKILMANNLSDVLFGGKAGDLALIEQTDAGVRTFTYGELNARVNALGRGLRARFGGAPFRVAVLARNSADYVVIYFAAMRAGGTVVPF